MTTNSYAGVVDNTTDAGFRAWGSALSSALVTAGLVDAGDTGQINWTTVVRPAVSTAAGYEIRRFADSSLFFKIEYGAGTAVTTPQMWITVGTGSNGSGTLTGQLSTRSIFTAQSTPSSTSTAYNTYICVVNGLALSICWALNGFGSSDRPGGFVAIGRSVNGSGVATSTGFSVWRMTGTNPNLRLQSVRTTATAQTFTDSEFHTIVPGNPSSSLVSGNNQAYTVWSNYPDVQPFLAGCVIVASEVTEGNTFSVAMVGSTAHTYLAVGLLGTGLGAANSQSTVYGSAMIYE